MKKVFLIIFVFIFSISFSIFAEARTNEATPVIQNKKEKIGYPIREIDRPLSIPTTAWQINFGLDNYNFYSIPLSSLEIPHLSFNDRFEIYFFGPKIKLFLFNNCKITQNVRRLAGFNMALIAGITKIPLFDAHIGFIVPKLGLGYQMKLPVTCNIWLYSNGFFDKYITQLAYYKQFDASIFSGIGFQISNKFSLITSCRYSNEGINGYYLTFPIDFKFNFNRHHGLLFRIGPYFYDSIFTSSLNMVAGLQYNLII